MRKWILALSVCALIPMVSIAVAYADDDEDIEYIDDEEYDTDSSYEDDSEIETTTEEETVSEIRAVAKRMTCDDIKKEMDKLGAISQLNEDEAEQLATLKSDYRSKCAKKTGAGRRSAGRSKVKATVAAVAATSNAKALAAANAGCDNPDANGCCPGETYTDMGEDGFYCCNDENCFPPMKQQKESKLCDDGSKPDKNGCCKGEKYTDLGAQGFNCCLSDKVTCFPPLK